MSLARTLTFVLALTCLGAPAGAQRDTRLDWWQRARFGLFVHFGLYAVPEGRWGERDGYGEWLLSSARIPLPEYEALAPRFTLERFDAREWARLAHEAGMGYVVVTTKHHDGFCLFDSAHTDWDMERTPARRDLMREVADAFRAEGLAIGWYHSIMDWHHADYLPRREWDPRPTADADMERYVAHLRAQVTELLSNYGPIGVMWFDGQWETTWNHARGQALYDLCRALQPSVVVNNRVDVGFGQDGLTTDARFAGDYGTPEQSIPAAPPRGVPWETCLTMNRHWGWNAADTQWKSATELVRVLVDVVSKGGNLLLNVGPRPDGTFPPLAVERLRAIGAWMAVNGEAIHGADRSAFARPAWGRLTERRSEAGTRVFLHVFDWPADGRLELEGVGNDVAGAVALAQPTHALPVHVDPARPGELRIDVTDVARDEHVTVLALDLVGAPIPYLAPTLSAPSTLFVDGLDIELLTAAPELGLAVDLEDRASPGSGASFLLEPSRRPFKFQLTQSIIITARATHRGVEVGPEARWAFTCVEPAPGIALEDLAPTDGRALEAGLRLDVFEGDFEVLPPFDGAPATSGVALAIDVNADLARERVAARFTGWLVVERDAVYTFELGSDDGSRLWLGDRCVIDNDGLHGFKPVRGEVALGQGAHRITVGWFNRTGGAELALRMAPAGGELAPLATAQLRATPADR